MSKDKQLRETIAATLARYAPDAFTRMNPPLTPCGAEFPQAFSRREAALYRKLADKVLENMRAALAKPES